MPTYYIFFNLFISLNQLCSIIHLHLLVVIPILSVSGHAVGLAVVECLTKIIN